MTEYRKIVYMDVDTIALKNFDELFTLTGPAAFTGDFDAGKHVDRPNCGVFVAEPRIYSFKRLLGTMNHLDKYGNLMEQDFFKWIFRYSSIALPSIYNFMWTIYVDKQFSCALNREAKVFHFTVWSKSWLEAGKPKEWNEMEPIKIYDKMKKEANERHTERECSSA
jgi:lipopolysaccharide biosynthesis glycosyltransferase